MEFRKVLPGEEAEFSDYARPLWLDANESLVGGGRPMIEEICEDWIGPETVRRKIGEGFVFGYLMEDGRKAGFASFGIQGDGIIELDKLYLEPEFRGKGYGKSALEHVLEHGRSLGCSKAVLIVNSNNAPAISLYERFGFVTEEVKAYRRNGWPETRLYIMSKRIVRRPPKPLVGLYIQYTNQSCIGYNTLRLFFVHIARMYFILDSVI